MSIEYSRNFRRYVPILAFAVMSLSACTSNIHTPFAGQAPAPVDVEQRNASSTVFAYPKQEIIASNHDLHSDHHGYRLKRIQIPAQNDNGPAGNRISFRYYKHEDQDPRPLVIVLPIYGSYTYPSDKITAGLLKMNSPVNIALLEYDAHLFDFEGLAAAQTEAEAIRSIRDTRDDIIAGVVDVRRVIDWAEQQSNIDSDRIALISFSMSANIGALLAQHEPRLRAGIIAMAAAQFHEILLVCPGRPGQAREAVMQRFDWSAQHYRQLWLESLGAVDPATYPGMADPSRLLMIDAHYDECMPQATRDALWESLGRPERISYRYTHKKSFYAMTPLGFNVMRRRIYEFVQSKLELTES